MDATTDRPDGFEQVQAHTIRPGDYIGDVWGGRRPVRYITPRAHGRVEIGFSDQAFPPYETFNAAQSVFRATA